MMNEDFLNISLTQVVISKKKMHKAALFKPKTTNVQFQPGQIKASALTLKGSTCKVVAGLKIT